MSFNIGPVKLKRLSILAVAPMYAHKNDTGCDLSIIEDYVFLPMDRKLVRTGWAIELPYGFDAQIRPRSGIAFKKGITLINCVATIDHGYKGELLIPLINLNTEKVTLCCGEKVAQLCFSHIYRASGFKEVTEFTTSDRNKNGFGSTDE